MMNYRINRTRNILTGLLLISLLGSASANCLRFEESDFDNTTGLGNALLFLLIPQNSIFALGQADTSTVQGVQRGFQRPSDVLVVGSQMVVVDNRLKRVLIYNSVPTSTGGVPDVALGHPDVHTGGIQVVSLPINDLYMNDPVGVASDGTRLIVTDRNANRVLIWNTIPTTSLTPANVVLGQTDFSSTAMGSSTTLMNQPTRAAVCNGRLYVADTGNNRVMGWNSIPTANNTPADFVFGQPNTTANAAGTTAAQMAGPYGITCSGTQMFVADTGNNRVMLYTSIPTTTGASANFVVGQASFGPTGNGATANQLFGPEGVHVDAVNDRLYVADTQNNRLLYYSPIPTTDGVGAVGLLGQNAFGNTMANNSSLANGMAEPVAVFVNGGRIHLADRLNNRIMTWTDLAPPFFEAVNYVVGQPAITTGNEYYAGASLSLMRQAVDVYSNGTSLFSLSDINNRGLRWATVPESTTAADTVFGQPNANAIGQNNPSISGATVNMPLGVCATSDRLYVADGQNHRVLVWSTIPTATGIAADLVLGQANFTGNMSNAGGSAQQNTLNAPNSVYCDSQRVVVSDSGNNRVLIWNSPPTSTMQNADIVVGQTNFTNSTSGPANFNGLRGVHVDGDKLIVADSSQHRVLIWNSIPTTNGVSPDIVLGQTNFTNISPNGGSANVNANGFSSPAGLATHDGALFVADLFNSRVLIWRSIPTATDTAPDLVWGQSDFTSFLPNASGISETSINVPFGLTVHDERLIIADAFNHRLISVPMTRLGLED